MTAFARPALFALPSWLLIAASILIAAGLGFLVWASLISPPMPAALSALQSDAQVSVLTTPWLVFRPVATPPHTGLIFYPGGRIDERSYAPSAHAIAAAGYLVVIPPMPLHLAVFAVERAMQIQAAFPEICCWAVGGHSLGGAMAAQFAFRHPQQAQGLVLWAAYPFRHLNLTGRRLSVVSISASLDGLTTPHKIQSSRAHLPPGTQWVAIPGGDHAQFAWYGPQSGDHPATISRESQQAQAVASTLDLLNTLDRTF